MIRLIHIGIRRSRDVSVKFKKKDSPKWDFFMEASKISIAITLIVMFLFGELFLPDTSYMTNMESKGALTPYVLPQMLVSIGIMYLVFYKRIMSNIPDEVIPLSKKEFRNLIIWYIFLVQLVVISMFLGWYLDF